MDLPSDFTPVVRAHLARSQAFLVAESGPCRDVQQEEIQRIRRNLYGRDLASLPTDSLSPFTVVAILICSLEEYRVFLEWAYERTWEELRRIFVYVPAGMMETLRKEQVHHEVVFDIKGFRGFGDFHKHFGNVFNRRIYLDAKERVDPDV